MLIHLFFERSNILDLIASSANSGQQQEQAGHWLEWSFTWKQAADESCWLCWELWRLVPTNRKISGLQKTLKNNMSNMPSPCSTVKHALDRCGWRQDLTILSDCTPERAGWLGRRYTTSLTQRITDRSGGKMDWYMKYWVGWVGECLV